jgi:hypothetical protein
LLALIFGHPGRNVYAKALHFGCMMHGLCTIWMFDA